MGVTTENSAVCLEKTLRREILDKGKVVPVVNMDMSKLIKGVTQRVFPDADIVVDKFHVIKYTNRVIDICRIATEKTINERYEIKRLLVMKLEKFHQCKRKKKWKYKAQRMKEAIQTHPEIKALWDLKNKMHGFYRCESLETAKRSWNHLLNFLDQNTTLHPEFAELKKTLINWETEILNYFIHKTTNGFIEGINNRIETIKRKKFGFRNKYKFIKHLCYALSPISLVFHDLIFTHF